MPHLADVKPFGRYVMTDVDRIGGIPVVMKALLDAGLLHGDALTVTGRTMAENLADIAPPDPDGEVIRALTDPIHRTGGLTILHGSLAPEGAVVKTAGFDADVFEGTARVFDREQAGDGRASPTARSRPATSSSSARRAPRAARACARCSRSPARSRAPGSARTSCCSPTAGSPAARPGCASATSRPRRRDGGPIALVADGDRIRLDIADRARSTCSSTTTSSSGAAPAGSRCAAAVRHGVLRQVRQARRLRRRTARSAADDPLAHARRRPKSLRCSHILWCAESM